MTFKTHLSVLYWSASLYPSYAAFKIPESRSESDELIQWRQITYRQFLDDVELSAKYWTRLLVMNDIPRRSVVGIWLGGMTYMDVLHIYGIARSGYIPQLFSIRLPNPDVIYELMRRVDGRALVYDSSSESAVTGCPVPAWVAVDLHFVNVTNAPLPPMPEVQNGEDTVMIFHTSGSTSGSPKLVPCSYKWLDAVVTKMGHACKPYNSHRQDVSVWMGSMCHIGQNCQLIGGLQHGSCIVQPTQIAFSQDELVAMIHRCGLNRLNQWATSVVGHLRSSRQNPKLLAMLQSLDEVMYAGLMLPLEEEEWAHQNGIPLRNMFGNTECGAMLLSIGGRGRDSPYLRPIEGTSYGFFPISSTSQQSGVPYRNAHAQLLELVILSESGDCPDVSLRSSDGHFHTGDLFIEITPGHYIFRGRDDDWIKSENSLRCDTKAIEDNVRATCNDLVAECVVVGNGRPSPTLFIEPKGVVDAEKLKRDIIRRTRHFHSRRYLHERIDSPRFIIVVPQNALPRTTNKGNIRRRAVEETYKTELDRVYEVVS
ncbi:hypothetical protein AcV5_004699 [Taiwanofungus camphoratus]|nr:hypothetical protein AcV5_004699 [Antrodia cinnamomea]